MASKEIGDLTAGSTPTGAELVHGEQSGNSRKFTFDQLRGYPTGGTALLAQGDMLYVNGSGELERLPKGTAGQVLRQNSGATAPEWATAPFTKEYVSAQQVITNGGYLELTHGLGAIPKLIMPALVCISAQGGYSAGSIIPAPYATSSAGTDGFGVAADISGTTIITIRFGAAGFLATHKDTGAAFGLTSANWRFVMRAWA